MNFTVIIATCGRPERLGKTLGLLAEAIRVSGESHRIVVADNHPDYIAEPVVTAFSGTFPGIVRYLKTAPRDKSRALNEGIRVADTEWLAFTDDDTLPEPDWLKEGAAFAGGSQFRVFGGRILPGTMDLARLPVWMRPGRSGRVPGIGVEIRFEPAQESGLLMKSYAAPFGANLFAHRNVFRDYGGYDEGLWALCVGWPVGSEDSEFGWRLREAGEPIGYCKEALVVHPVNYDRASLMLHVRHAYYEGWRQPLVFMRYGERTAWLSPFKIRLVFEHVGGFLPDFVFSDRGGMADHLVETMRLLGSIMGRWSSAYRKRLAGFKRK